MIYGKTNQERDRVRGLKLLKRALYGERRFAWSPVRLSSGRSVGLGFYYVYPSLELTPYSPDFPYYRPENVVCGHVEAPTISAEGNRDDYCVLRVGQNIHRRDGAFKIAQHIYKGTNNIWLDADSKIRGEKGEFYAFVK